MVEYVPTIWLLIAVLFPMAFLIIGIIDLVNKVRIREVFIKLLIAFLFYVPITILCAVYVASLINYIEDTKGITVKGVRVTATLDFVSLAIIYAHIILGLFSCWFVSKDLTQVFRLFSGNKQKTRSFFNTK